MSVKNYNKLIAELNGDLLKAQKGFNWFTSLPLSSQKSIKEKCVVQFVLDNQYIW